MSRTTQEAYRILPVKRYCRLAARSKSNPRITWPRLYVSGTPLFDGKAPHALTSHSRSDVRRVLWLTKNSIGECLL